jgi:D-alanine-D-alanine ligase
LNALRHGGSKYKWGGVMGRVAAARALVREIASVNLNNHGQFALQQAIECLKPKLRLAVIFGGSKESLGSVLYRSQNTRSWKSYEVVAEDIAASLRRSGFKHVSVMPEDMNLGERLRREGIHMAWLNTGGVQGRNSCAHAASTLEMLGIPYVGHDPLSATTLDNKHAFKREAVCAGLPTAMFTTWDMTRGPFEPKRNSRFTIAFGEYRGPFIVKPVSGRASLNVHVVQDVSELPEVVAEVYHQSGNLVLIEKYLSGREFCIAVAGRITAKNGVIRDGQKPFAFGALERVFCDEELIFTSMDTRPITGERFKEVDPSETVLWSELHELGRQVFLEFNLGSIIRIDVRADERGKLHILEANPKPDLKFPIEGVTSLVHAGLAQTDLGYDDLIMSLFADRLNFVLEHSRDAVGHISELLLNAEQNGSRVFTKNLTELAQAMRA